MRQKSSLILLLVLVLITAPACRLFSALTEGQEPGAAPDLGAPDNTNGQPPDSGSAGPTAVAKEIVQPTLPALESPSRVGDAILATLARYPRTLRGELSQPGDSFPTLITIWYESESVFQFEVIYPDGRFLEFITLPPQAYLNPAGSWEPYQGDYTEAVFETYDRLNTALSGLAALIPEGDPPSSEGEEIIEVPTERYAFEVLLPEGGNRSVQLWVGIEDGLVYKYTFSDSDGASEEGLLNFSTPVVIEPPIQDDSEE